MLYARELFAWLEPVLVLLLVLLVALAPTWLRTPARAASRRFRALAARPRRAFVVAFVFGALGSAGVAAWVGLPQPRVSDELSYLLAADHFAQGRASAPTPPSPAHFETFFVLVRPRYASKYPPAQALSLALGQVLTGHPAISLWVSAGLLCALVFWGLRAWVPSPWALLGALLVGVRLAVASYWSHSYWGGLVAAIGGALVWGAAARLVWPPGGAVARAANARRALAGHGLLLGTGVVILANSRPLEGMVVALPAAVLLASWAMAQVRGRAQGEGSLGAVLAVALPAAAVLAIGAVGMLRYNLAVTGDPLRLPYGVWEQQYATVPNVSGRPLRMIETPRPDTIARFYDLLAEQYDPQRRWLGVRAGAERLLRNSEFFWGLGLAIPALLALVSTSDGRVRWAWAVIALLFAVQLVLRPWWPHYSAPAVLVLMAPAVVGLRQIWRHELWRGVRLLGARSAGGGESLVAGVVGICLVMLGPQLLERHREQGGWGHTRARIAADLAASGPADIVFVRYGPDHHPAREWVFNAGDLAATPVLWARDLGADANRAVLAAFPQRAAWLLEVDVAGQDRPTLKRYSPRVPVHSRARP